jgi:DHA1 family multidrug resistance protein-like MFS transporter
VGVSISALSRRLLLQGNVRILATTSFVTGTKVGMLNTTLQPFVLSLGLGLPVLGLLQALGSRPWGLSSSLIQPFAGHYADLFGRKFIIALGSVVSILSMILFLLAATVHSWPILLTAFLLFGLGLLSSPASQAVVAESVNLQPAKMDVAFSTVFFFTSVPGAVTAIVAGVLADALGYYLVFAVAVVLESANLVILLTKLRETRLGGRLAGAPLKRNSFSFRASLKLPRGFLGFFATLATDAFSFTITSSIFYGMLVKQYGYSNTDIGLIVGTLSFAIILAQYPAARFLVRVGPKRSLAFSEFLSVLVLLGWNLAISLPVFLFLSVLFGVSIATWVPALQSLIMTHAPPEERGSLGGKLAAFRGLAAFPAPIIGGILFDKFGYHAPIMMSLVGIVLAVVMIVKLLPDKATA